MHRPDRAPAPNDLARYYNRIAGFSLPKFRTPKPAGEAVGADVTPQTPPDIATARLANDVSHRDRLLWRKALATGCPKDVGKPRPGRNGRLAVPGRTGGRCEDRRRGPQCRVSCLGCCRRRSRSGRPRTRPRRRASRLHICFGHSLGRNRSVDALPGRSLPKLIASYGFRCRRSA